MSRRYLRSDFSEEEARFFVAGKPVVGTGNVLTGLIKYIGKYTELQQYGRTDEISLYNPDSDVFFMYENMGYTTLRKILAKTTIPISRRYIKALSRKWPMSFVRISFDATHIISVLLEYIFSNYDQKLCAWHTCQIMISRPDGIELFRFNMSF